MITTRLTRLTLGLLMLAGGTGVLNAKGVIQAMGDPSGKKWKLELIYTEWSTVGEPSLILQKTGDVGANTKGQVADLPKHPSLVIDNHTNYTLTLNNFPKSLTHFSLKLSYGSETCFAVLSVEVEDENSKINPTYKPRIKSITPMQFTTKNAEGITTSFMPTADNWNKVFDTNDMRQNGDLILSKSPQTLTNITR
jgi:hypothetical protein